MQTNKNLNVNKVWINVSKKEILTLKQNPNNCGVEG